MKRSAGGESTLQAAVFWIPFLCVVAQIVVPIELVVLATILASLIWTTYALSLESEQVSRQKLPAEPAAELSWQSPVHKTLAPVESGITAVPPPPKHGLRWSIRSVLEALISAVMIATFAAGSCMDPIVMHLQLMQSGLNKTNPQAEDFVIMCGRPHPNYAPVGSLLGLAMVLLWSICRWQIRTDHQRLHAQVRR